jgi:hypothetical protein
VSDIWVNPTDSDTILVAVAGFSTEGGGVYRSTDGGTTWQVSYNFWASTLAEDPTDPDILYFGTERCGYVKRSTNGGISWTDITPDTEPEECWVWEVRDIEVDLNSHVYAATDEGLMKWDGSDWAKLMGLPTEDVTSIMIDRSETPGIVYVGTAEKGVFASQDGGSTWRGFNEGLGNLSVTKLAISPSPPRTLYAGTAYGGAWRRTIIEYHPGDVSGDGHVTLADAVLAVKVACGVDANGGHVTVGGDVNGNQKIGLEEAVYVLQTVAELRIQ